ncbi:hypothetical protein BpHYR1_009494 [Brachionus plicatilis]|uniref:Uncharacterized protein n=1 Tax=Brachionus plicatilis TaxID=10195 RepID=A0A3M7QI59_BRAPC|nr:hypothetical protein BpHYR1_009494 [Brachionus plicatilis]
MNSENLRQIEQLLDIISIIDSPDLDFFLGLLNNSSSTKNSSFISKNSYTLGLSNAIDLPYIRFYEVQYKRTEQNDKKLN